MMFSVVSIPNDGDILEGKISTQHCATTIMLTVIARPQTYIMYQMQYVLFTSYQIVKTRKLTT